MPKSLTDYTLIVLVAVVLLASQLLLKLGTRESGPLAMGSLADVGIVIRQVLTTPALLAGYALSGISALAWLIIVSRLDLSFATPLMTGLYYVLLLVGSAVILNEHMTPGRWTGALIVTLGILLISRSG